MLHKTNLISIAVTTAFLLTFMATVAFAQDTAKESGHQHQSGQSAAHGHGDMKSDDHHGHPCPHKMSSADQNKDGKISKEEFMKHHETIFDKKDANKDGVLDDTEMHRMMDHKHKHDYQKDKDGGHKHDDIKK
jgi:hypothetical protein